MRRIALSLLAGMALVACGDDTLPQNTGEIVRLERAGYIVRFDSNKITLDLMRGDDVLATIPGDGLELGTVDVIDDSVSYDPWPIVGEVEGYFPPAGLTFRGANRSTVQSESPTRIVVDLVHEGDVESQLEVIAEADGRFMVALVPKDATKVAYVRVGARVGPDEAYYGLGEHFDDVNQRGKRRAMQLEVDALESANNEAHVPVPLILGTRGWGMFVESSHPGAFDVASSDDARVQTVWGLGSAAEAGLKFHLLVADHPLDLTRIYYELTGFPRLPAPWALGPLVWRDENDDQAQVETDLDTMRDLDLPANGIWIDRPYATGVQTFDFEAARFPDPTAMIGKAHDLGFRVGLWQVPYLDEADPATATLRTQVEQSGFYPVETGITLNGWGKPIDFTADGAMAFWQDQVSAYTALGIEGFKLDYAEDVVPGIFGARNVYTFQDGSDERTMHRGYTLLYHQAYAEMLPEEGGMLLCRAGKWGDQIHGPIIWPGDLDARLWTHRQEVTENGETFLAVGGLHASMIGGLTLGPSGFPFYGADTGGYRHSPPDKETFRRWFEQTALSSVMQIGTSSNDVAWEFGDTELLDSYREYTRLHLRLFPYAWSLAQDIATTGRPITRPFGLVEPELRKHPSDQYFFGDALLVAPVTSAGVTEREVSLPSGTWVDFWDGATTEGPTVIDVAAPLGRLPLFLRAGAPLPMLRPTIDTLSPTTDPARVDSFDTVVGPLSIRLAPGPSASLRLYDGTLLDQDDATGVALTIEPGTTFVQGAVLEVVAWGGTRPDAVLLDGSPLLEATSLAVLNTLFDGWFFEPAATGGTVWVKVPGGTHTVVVDR